MGSLPASPSTIGSEPFLDFPSDFVRFGESVEFRLGKDQEETLLGWMLGERCYLEEIRIDHPDPIDWTRAHEWTFAPLDEDVFGAIRLARQVGEKGSTFPAVYNAANEIAVAAFLEGRIRFTQIAELIAEAGPYKPRPGDGAAYDWLVRTILFQQLAGSAPDDSLSPAIALIGEVAAHPARIGAVVAQLPKQ